MRLLLADDHALVRGGLRTLIAGLPEIDEVVEAEVRDNGRGITEDEANNISALGLLGVRERAYALGGETVIEAIPGQGTRVFVSLPR